MAQQKRVRYRAQEEEKERLGVHVNVQWSKETKRAHESISKVQGEVTKKANQVYG